MFVFEETMPSSWLLNPTYKLPLTMLESIKACTFQIYIYVTCKIIKESNEVPDFHRTAFTLQPYAS